jgi:hypothetical protein
LSEIAFVTPDISIMKRAMLDGKKKGRQPMKPVCLPKVVEREV